MFLASQLIAQDLTFTSVEGEYSSEDQQNWSSTMPTESGNYWYKKSFDISSSGDSLTLYGIGISMLASTKVYWDGAIVGYNGIIGKNASEENPGKMMSIHMLSPQQLSIGNHELLVEFSNHHSNKFRLYAATIFDYDEVLQKPIILTAYVHIYAGLFLIIGLFYLVRYLIDRKSPATMLFSMLCLFFFSLIIIEYVKNYYIYPYPLHFMRLKVIYAVTAIISLIMPIFFLYRFEIERKWLWVLACIALLLPLIFTISYGYDLATNTSMIIGFVISSVICAWAYKLKRKGALFLLATLLPVPIALLLWNRYYDLTLYVGFGFLIIVNLISLALTERENQKEKEEAKLISSRLKLELLKKNIQPHFINNSITSAIDWIERNPQKGVDLLFALSREFDILNDISERKLIPIIKELELCRAHLEIMGFRKEEDYELITHNIDEHDIVPPAIFLTLVENGISHKNSGNKSMRFILNYECSKHSKVYEFLAEGEAGELDFEITYGTGLRYIEARLEESFPGHWTFSSEPSQAGWLSRIEIKN